MKKLSLLVVEGNLLIENKNFKDAGIQTHTESLKESISNYQKKINYEILNPSSEENFNKIINKLESFDGMVWGGSSLNIYNDTPEIRRQIYFMKECFKRVKNIFAICWGMQVAVTAAGGIVRKSINGAHIGIAKNIKINNEGLKHPIYKNKKSLFNTPAFNFDEVETLPDGAMLLSSNPINKVQGLQFEVGVSKIWGIQYHPEITYEKMISLINFRKDRLINYRKVFENENDIDVHIKNIEQENKVTDKNSRMQELKNWLEYLNEN
jgi:GMP synthase (glutamine-hydrolysing)|tara:strand:- start:878 stop:1675 length:798 start_codon:yes stop_codon:yes gene_type:complete